MTAFLGAAFVTLALTWAAGAVAGRVLPARRLRASLARFPEVIAEPGRLAHVTDHTPFAAVELLYSIALFDLAGGPVCVSMPAYDNHWSLQVLSEDADNVAWRSGKGGEGERRFVLRNVLLSRGDAVAVPEGHDVLDVPVRGVAVLRWLVRDETDRPRVDALRRGATITGRCATG
jgi:uncharacterized membrane protein